MASAFAAFFFFFFLIFNLASLHHRVLARDVVEIEEGYTVTTVIDGHKLGINPRSILSKPGSSDLLLLDSVSILARDVVEIEEGYTVTTVIDGHKLGINPRSILSKPGSSDLLLLDSVSKSKVQVNRLAGASDRNGGYADGELDSARFNKPRSFAVDLKGNVYVADKTNHAIRKISNTGVKTIAGGYSKNPGHQDGPAKNASFSDDFEISFVPEKCALLISDHGNQLVRQISLKAEDCVRGSQFALEQFQFGFWTGTLMFTWLDCGDCSSALYLSSSLEQFQFGFWTGTLCLLGLIVGIAVQPYIFRRTERLQPPVFQDMDALPNPSGETSTDTLLRHQKRSC
ncbi:protein suppressor of quenching 1 [Quercus suber]|uniref:Protein suppressor of quenching 1 n=1 Tax=Quercus suber TaxID=58331 RepID=A0AAW0KX04_QUESU